MKEKQYYINRKQRSTLLSAVGFLDVPMSYIGVRMKMEPNAFTKIRSKGRLEKQQ